MRLRTTFSFCIHFVQRCTTVVCSIPLKWHKRFKTKHRAFRPACAAHAQIQICQQNNPKIPLQSGIFYIMKLDDYCKIMNFICSYKKRIKIRELKDLFPKSVQTIYQSLHTTFWAIIQGFVFVILMLSYTCIQHSSFFECDSSTHMNRN